MEEPQEKQEEQNNRSRSNSESSRNNSESSKSRMSTSTSSEEDTSKSKRIMDGTSVGNLMLRRSIRKTHPPPRYNDYDLMSNLMNIGEPMNYKQAKDKAEWVEAMNEEYNSIMKNQTWELNACRCPGTTQPRLTLLIFKEEMHYIYSLSHKQQIHWI